MYNHDEMIRFLLVYHSKLMIMKSFLHLYMISKSGFFKVAIRIFKTLSKIKKYKIYETLRQKIE
jgi:hypothetical protein